MILLLGLAAYVVFQFAQQNPSASAGSQPVNSGSNMPTGNPGMVSTSDLSWRGITPTNAAGSGGGGFGANAVPQAFFGGWNAASPKASPPAVQQQSDGGQFSWAANWSSGANISPTSENAHFQQAYQDVEAASAASAAQQLQQFQQQAQQQAQQKWVYCGPACYKIYDQSGNQVGQVGAPGGSASSLLSNIASSVPQ